MPAYFSMDFRFRRTCLRQDLIIDFYKSMETAGFPFWRGYYEAEAMTMSEIAQFNQKRLEENFVLGFTETRINDYKQVYFKRPEYQEIRGFWENMPEENEFYFCLIIPESDMIKCKKDSLYFRRKQLEPVICLAEAMWVFEGVEAIQTGLELDDTAALEELAKGVEPCIRPFAIIPSLLKADRYKQYYVTHSIEREGMCLLDGRLFHDKGKFYNSFINGVFFL